MHCRVQCSIITAAKTRRQPKCPSPDDQIKKVCCMLATEYHSSMRKQHILPFVTRRMDPEGIVPSEITHSDRDRHAKTSLIHEVWKSLTNKTKWERTLKNTHAYH